jgi:hypothetical protein
MITLQRSTKLELTMGVKLAFINVTGKIRLLM